MFLLWLFPDGRVPAGRWHKVSVAVATAGLLLGVATTVGPGLAAVAGHDVHIDVGGNLYPVSPAWTISGNVTSTAALASVAGLRRHRGAEVPPVRRRGPVASLTAWLRQTVDLDAVQGELMSTVHHAFEPAHVSIWSAPTRPRAR